MVLRRLVNMSPLIPLSKIGLPDLLRAGDLHVIVPHECRWLAPSTCLVRISLKQNRTKATKGESDCP